MSNLSTFLTVFISVLVIAGWVSSEMISSKARRESKKSNLRLAKLEKENDILTSSASKEQGRYSRLKEEFDKAKEARDQLKEFEREYKQLIKAYNQFSTSIESLRTMVSAKKYKSNALSREVIAHMDENLPNEDKIKMMKEESTRAAFKRIKDRIDT